MRVKEMWFCAHCGIVNFIGHSCRKCGTPRAGTFGKKKAASRKSSPRQRIRKPYRVSSSGLLESYYFPKKQEEQ